MPATAASRARLPALARRMMAQLSTSAGFTLAAEPPGGPTGNGAARAGVLRTRSGELPTPGLILLTRRGLPPHLAPDVLAGLRPAAPAALALHVNPLHFVEHPSPEQIRGGGAGGAHTLLGLNGPGEHTAIVCSARDPVAFDFGARPCGPSAASVHTPGGFRQLTPARYMDVIEALAPDLYVALADEVSTDASAKRTKQAVERSNAWLAVCADRAAQTEAGGSLLFGLVGGGGSVEERRRSAAATAATAVRGFAIGGLGTSERPEERPALLRASLDPLPPGLPRYLSGLSNPLDLLSAVAEGVDLVDSAYPQLLTAAGCAMVFPVSESTLSVSSSSSSSSAPEAGGDAAKINLRAAVHRLDGRPMLPGCTCGACKKHTRAYLHHLLNTHEILADTLLDIHNSHHLLRLFDAVRQAIQAGRFAQYLAWFTAALHQ